MQLFDVTEPKQSRKGRWLEPGLNLEVDADKRTIVPLATIEEYRFVLPLEPTLSHAAQLAMATNKDYNRIYKADVLRVKGDLVLGEEKDKNGTGDAVIVLSTSPGVNGKLRLSANTFNERVDTKQWGKHTHRKVVRVWHSFPPAGVELLNPEHVTIDAEGICSCNPECKATGMPPILLRMVLGSSFRVWRDGELGGAAPVFLVSWSRGKDGNQLWTIVPERYRNRTGYSDEYFTGSTG